MQVTLAYGRSGLAVELPEEWTDVVEPRDVAGLPDKPAAVSATPRAPTISISASAAASTTASAPPSRGSRPPSRWENSYGGLTARASSSTRRRTVTTPLCVARDISLSTSTACEPEAQGDDPGDG